MEKFEMPKNEDLNVEAKNDESAYDSLDELFNCEDLKEDIDDVRFQMEKIKGLIEEYQELHEEYKQDEEPSERLTDELIELDTKVRQALTEFKINGKKFDLIEISKKNGPVDTYNEVVYEINSYIGLFMIGKGEDLFKQIGL
jgi:DNA repair exonuclease SbcCD ATPase subunit